MLFDNLNLGNEKEEKMSYPYKGKKVVLVCNKFQKKPATKYGTQQFGEGNFIVVVSKNPVKRKKHIGKNKTTIYNFK